MTFRIYIFFFICLGLSWMPAQGENYENEITICSFNIRGSNMDTGVNAWSNRKKMVIREFTNYRYDIVCMQEPLADQVQDFLSIGIYEWLGVSAQGTADTDVFTPIFYNKKKLNVLDYGTFWLSETPDVVSKGWDGKFPRICTWAKFRDIENCRTFYVFNTHLDHVGQVARDEGVNLLRERIEALRGDRPVILTGDFNSEPGSSVVAHVQKDGVLHDVKQVAARKSGTEWSFSDFGQIPESERPLLDYIFVSDGIAADLYEVLPDTLGGGYVSDHAPVMAIVKFEK